LHSVNAEDTETDRRARLTDEVGIVLLMCVSDKTRVPAAAETCRRREMVVTSDAFSGPSVAAETRVVLLIVVPAELRDGAVPKWKVGDPPVPGVDDWVTMMSVPIP
jgi:hypothetical protein